MERRKTLLNLTMLLILLFVLTFIYILIKGMSWTPAQEKRQFSDIAVSSTELVTLQGRRIWVTRLSELQRKNLMALNAVFVGGGCDIKLDVCRVASGTQRQGVIIRFIEEKPTSLNIDQRWFSGFINPTNGAVYDLLGRGYKTNSADALKTINVKY